MYYCMIIVIGTWLCLTSACPDTCKCFLDDRGRTKVLCEEGGLVGPLDVTQMDIGTEILEITSPDDNYNSIMIGPIFSKFHKIEEIHLKRSNIPEIGMHSFWRLDTLRVLNLRENNISTVLNHNFRGLPKLEELYLDDNRIDRLSSATFRYLDNLLILSLARNRLNELVTRTFERLTKLQELILSENCLKTLNPEIFVDIQNLKVFQCRSCGLKVFSTEVPQYISELTTLDLGDNLFETLPSNSFVNLIHLTSLALDGNQLSYIVSETFAAQTHLQRLNLARNQLSYLPQTLFDNISALIDFDLSFNQLTELDPCAFEPIADTLQIFNVSGNKQLSLVKFQNVLQMSRKIIDLSLADMDLRELPLTLFNYNPKLRRLNIGGNRFQHFPVDSLSSIAKLSTLDFSRNLLRGLDDKSLQRIELIDNVDIRYNRWSCDLCFIVPMLEKMRDLKFINDLQCHSPNYLKGRKLSQVTLLDLKKCSVAESSGGYDSISGEFPVDDGRLGVIAAGAGLCLLALTILALLAGICYSRRHAANYYTHEEKRIMESEDPTEDILFGDNHGEISFKFPMPIEKKVTISTIEEIKKDPDISKGA